MIYLTVGLAGYFSTYADTKKIVLEMTAPGGTEIEPAMYAAILGILALMVVHIPVNYHPFRQLVIYMKYKHERFSQTENLAVTILFLTVSTSIAIAVPDIAKVLSIIGGFCSVSVSFTIPVFCYIRLSPNGISYWKNWTSMLLGVALGLIGYTNVIMTVGGLIMS